MKRLFVAFLLIGFFASSSAWGADKSNIVDSTRNDASFIAQTYNETLRYTQSMSKTLRANAYYSTARIFNNIISILIATIAVFWLFKHIKNGVISREEVYKALMFVIVFVIVYVILNSKAAFDAVVEVLNIPKKLVISAISDGLAGGNISEKLNQALVRPFFLIYDIVAKIFKEVWNNYSGFGKFLALAVAPTTTIALGIMYSIYLIMLFIVVIAIIIIHMYSTFLQAIYLAFLPITIPLLLIPQTKSIFFACLKAYIGITMYVPLTMIPINIIGEVSNKIAQTSIDNIVLKLYFFIMLGMITCIIGIALLKKIPSWINELLGVSDQGVGIGGALGMMKTAGMGIGAAALGYGKGIASSIGNAKGAKGKAGAIAANLLTGGLAGGAMGMAKGIGELVKNGFKTKANHFSGKGQRGAMEDTIRDNVKESALKSK